ncbi:MAG: hypothetical protein IH593_11325, partial [Bacteroidales bacterium]|nr:hypothetical protein [Bacteroidales bacterium]
MEKKKFIYRCNDCGREYEAGDIIYLCPFCSRSNIPGKPVHGVLKIIYDYREVRKRNRGFENLKKSGFIDLLPISSTESLPRLR